MSASPTRSTPEEEHAAAVAFAAANGVSLSALTTALCRWVKTEEETSPEVERCIKMLLAEARRIDADRGKRGRN